MRTMVYYPKLQDMKEIGRKLTSINYRPGPKDPILGCPYEFVKGSSVVMARFYEPHDHDVGGLEGPWMNGRILAIEGAERDIQELIKILPKDQSRDLDEYTRRVYLQELRRVKKDLAV